MSEIEQLRDEECYAEMAGGDCSCSRCTTPAVPEIVRLRVEIDAAQATVVQMLAALKFASEKILKLHVEAGDGECHYPMIEDAIALPTNFEATHEARAVIAATPVPADMVMVPIEPSDAMVQAGWDVEELKTPEKIYRAMIAAAQEEVK